MVFLAAKVFASMVVVGFLMAISFDSYAFGRYSRLNNMLAATGKWLIGLGIAGLALTVVWGVPWQ